jgi:hypothetical protein
MYPRSIFYEAREVQILSGFNDRSNGNNKWGKRSDCDDRVKNLLHSAVEMDQIIVLHTELVKDKVNDVLDSKDTLQISETLDSILSSAKENSRLINEARKLLVAD